jgi:dienelactone hydrolase
MDSNILVSKKTAGRHSFYDITKNETTSKKPILIFLHGFKGFKDFAFFPALAQKSAKEGYIHIGLNFSHNGTTPDHPYDFVDLEAFGLNNFSKELEDIEHLLADIRQNKNRLFSQWDQEHIFILGHSRGGSTAILAAKEFPEITAVATWAAVIDIIERYGKADLEKWKRDGVKYILNGRTEQNMPLYYQLSEDILTQKDRFNIPAIIQHNQVSLLLVHGEQDPVVSVEEWELIPKHATPLNTFIIPGADHVFGGKHPWKVQDLPEPAQKAWTRTVAFFNSYSR